MSAALCCEHFCLQNPPLCDQIVHRGGLQDSCGKIQSLFPLLVAVCALPAVCQTSCRHDRRWRLYSPKGRILEDTRRPLLKMHACIRNIARLTTSRLLQGTLHSRAHLSARCIFLKKIQICQNLHACEGGPNVRTQTESCFVNRIHKTRLPHRLRHEICTSVTLCRESCT